MKSTNFQEPVGQHVIREVAKPFIVGLKVAAFVAPLAVVIALASRLSGK